MSSASGTTGTMAVKVLLFATYAEQAGRGEVDLTLPTPATVEDVLRTLRGVLPASDRLPARPLAAVNRAHARLSTPVQHGDEIAFLPPLAGG